MTRITPEHLSRAAWVYVRQSTPGQVRHNHESRGRQYALKDRARQLGWSDVVLVDDDLGRSGGGTERPGYDRLLAAVCRGEVGAVLSLEASRLARNGREWHTLIDYCGLVGCLLADETCVYDPRLPDDLGTLLMAGPGSLQRPAIDRPPGKRGVQFRHGRDHTPRRWRRGGCSVGRSSGVAAGPEGGRRRRSARGKLRLDKPAPTVAQQQRFPARSVGARGGHEGPVVEVYTGPLDPTSERPFQRYPNALERTLASTDARSVARPLSHGPLTRRRSRPRSIASAVSQPTGSRSHVTSPLRCGYPSRRLGYRTPQTSADGRSTPLGGLSCFFRKPFEPTRVAVFDQFSVLARQ